MIQKSEIKRLDHLGVIAGLIKELGLKELLEQKLGTHQDEKISTGEAIIGMILNGLGFTNSVLSLSPQFFENRPVELLFREGVKAEDFNHYKLGRSLEKCFEYGTEALFSELALEICKKENVDRRFNHLDTTSFSTYGTYENQADDEEVEINLGYSKDHRPDLKQMVLEMMVTQDGGIPILGKCLSGNSSDSKVFEKRSQELKQQFAASEEIKYLIADSKLYSEPNAENLKQLQFITRIPDSIKETRSCIDKAIEQPDNWETLEDGRLMQVIEIEHYGMKQRWHVLSSETSSERAQKQVDKKLSKESELIEKQLYHLQAQRFNCEQDAQLAAQTLAKKWKLHQLEQTEIKQHQKFDGKGRPKKNQQPTLIQYQIEATFQPDQAKIIMLKQRNSCYVIGSNAIELSSQEIIEAYKNQYHVERGFRYLKNPQFFAPAFFVKNPKRMTGLVMVMLLALLIYTIAERRLRQKLKQLNETLPNQIKQQIQNPTLRWVFQLLEGINYVNLIITDQFHAFVDGLNALRVKILSLFGPFVTSLYLMRQ